MSQTKTTQINPVIYFLVLMFGSAAMMGSLSSWVEMSIFTQRLPEGWSLASILTLTISASSIGPLIFMLLDRCFKIPIRHGLIIQISVIICALVYIPLMLAWDKTIVIFGTSHSITLISSIFVLGTIAIGSDIVWVPYMANFGPQYLPAYFVGSGWSALFASLLSLMQGTSGYTCQPDPKTGELAPVFAPPHFSVSAFYLVVFIWVCGSVVSFYLLNNHFELVDRLSSRLLGRRADREQSRVELVESIDGEVGKEPIGAGIMQASSDFPPPHAIYRTNRKEDALLLFLIGFIAAQMNTLMSSVQSYASIPYSQTTYFWAMIISTATSPVFAFLAGVVPVRRIPIIVLLSMLCTFGSGMTTLLAFQSPNPWLKGSIWGSIMTIIFQVISYAFGSFLRTALIETFRDGQPENESRLFWAGLAAQIGSFTGTCLVFPSVNIFHFFEAASQC